MESKVSPAKTQLVFKIEKEPAGFNQVLAENCKIVIEKTAGPLYLNYEKRIDRVVGFYDNLRQEGDMILADVRLLETLTPIDARIDYSIEGSVLKKNEKGEAESIKVRGVGALMDNKF